MQGVGVDVLHAHGASIELLVPTQPHRLAFDTDQGGGVRLFNVHHTVHAQEHDLVQWLGLYHLR